MDQEDLSKYKMSEEYIDDNVQRFLAASGGEIKAARIILMFPGLVKTPYILKVWAPFAADMSTSAALDVVIKYIWEAMDPPMRDRIFMAVIDETQEAYESPVVHPHEEEYT